MSRRNPLVPYLAALLLADIDQDGRTQLEIQKAAGQKNPVFISTLKARVRNRLKTTARLSTIQGFAKALGTDWRKYVQNADSVVPAKPVTNGNGHTNGTGITTNGMAMFQLGRTVAMYPQIEGFASLILENTDARRKLRTILGTLPE